MVNTYIQEVSICDIMCFPVPPLRPGTTIIFPLFSFKHNDNLKKSHRLKEEKLWSAQRLIQVQKFIQIAETSYVAISADRPIHIPTVRVNLEYFRKEQI